MSIFDKDDKKNIKKGTILLRQGEVCRFGCKVVKGCLKSYIIDNSGKEHIMQFAPEGWLITDMESLFHKTPSSIFIEAIEDSEVIWINENVDNYWENASRSQILEQINLLTNNIIASNKRTRLLLSSSAKQRYLDFIQTYPTLMQRLPLKQIASYLGITPEYLSEIRRELTEK
jgi:CRP-like cAMP-binding protein